MSHYYYHIIIYIFSVIHRQTMEYKNTKHNKKFKKDTSDLSIVTFKIREARGTGWLSFNDFKLGRVPSELYTRLKSLKYLYMSKCHLGGELPVELGNLSNLVALDVSFNKLVSIPDKIFANMKNLEILDISHNKLTTLPYSVGELDHCKELMVASNNLVALPHTIAHMKRLEIIDASSNMIQTVQGATFTGGLTGTLHILRLANNRLDRLPREVGWLTQLEELDVSNNELYFLPATCRSLRRLKVLRFKGNKWSNAAPQYQEKYEDLNASYGRKALKTAFTLVHPSA